ncbi:MAG: RnfABCDGE type electron transport complex subunit G [Candidatus Zixiibacteriota bacterium]
MKDIMKLGIALMIYGIIAGFALGIINSKTAPVIAEQARAAKEAAIKEVLPQNAAQKTKTFTKDGEEIEYTIGYKSDAKKQPTGYAITAYGNGFSSTLKIMTGLNPDMTINKIKVIEQNETPGLGTHCEDPEFQSQFSGKSALDVAVESDGGNIDAITGATITSRAVADGINNFAKILADNLPKDSPMPDSIDAEADTTDTELPIDKNQETPGVKG